MLATQISQKGSNFYFIAWPAQDLLRHVKFTTRFYSEEDGQIAPTPIAEGDEIASFIGRIERNDKAFQRELSRAKVSSIMNFYETAESQPPIPGTVLLFTSERLPFTAIGQFQNVGDLEIPKAKFLIIDGQHRLAALEFYLRRQQKQAKDTLMVPCIIFDGKNDDFAAEMFVTINGTPTRINKSHLVDLYEKVQWERPDKRFAAQIAELLYSEAASPLRYKINRLGGRSQQKKWILQAELFNELHKWVADVKKADVNKANAVKRFEIVRDFLKAAEKVWMGAWGNERFMVTRPVTLKAMLRVCFDLYAADPQEEGRLARWTRKLEPWRQLDEDFKVDGFYERFAAAGQVERVARLHKHLRERIGVLARKRGAE